MDRVYHNENLERVAGWLAIVAMPLAFANVVLALVAIDWDLAAFGDFTLGLEIIAANPSGEALLRWSMIADMLGFYLFLVPLALVLRERYRARGGLQVDFYTLGGLGYLFFGAVGAAVLAAVLPAQLRAFAGGVGPEAQVSGALFLAFSSAIYDGVWGILDPILAGTWWLGMGLILRRERRILGWVTLILGAFMLLRDVKVGPLEMVGLGVYFVLAPIWGAWMGADLLRRRAGAREHQRRKAHG